MLTGKYASEGGILLCGLEQGRPCCGVLTGRRVSSKSACGEGYGSAWGCLSPYTFRGGKWGWVGLAVSSEHAVQLPTSDAARAVGD